MESQQIASAVADAVEFAAGETKFAPDAKDIEVFRPYPKSQAWFDIDIRNDDKREIFRVTIRKTTEGVTT